MEAAGYQRVPWYCGKCERNHIEWFMTPDDIIKFWVEVVRPMLEELRRKLEA